MKRWTTAGAVLTLTAALLTGCGVDESAGGPAPDELRLAVGGEPEDGFDPTLGWGRYGSPLFQSTLLKRDANLEIVNDLAISHEVSEDGLTWTVDIRTDAVFSNGDKVTPEDVAYTFETAGKSGGLTDVTVLSSAKAIDEDTVELHLKQPQSTFINRLVTLGIVPKGAHDEGYAAKPIGSGPFTFVHWDRGQQLIVKRNEEYYGKKPAFKKMVFVFTDEDGTLAAARSGEVHLAGVPASLAAQDINGMKLIEVESLDNRGLSLPTVPANGKKSPTGAPIGNNVTSDVAIRRALNVAVDRDLLVDAALEGYGSPAYGPVDAAPWFEEASKVADNDPEAAKTMLAAAGWKDNNGDGIREKDGTEAKFTAIYPAGDSIRQALTLSLVDMVKPIGIEIKAEGKSWEEIGKRQHADAVMFGWGSQDPTEIYNLYSSSLAGTESYNPNYYSNPIVDAHLEAAMAATDQESANKEWKAVQIDAEGNGTAAAADAPWLWLVNLDHTYFADDCLDLGDLQIEPHGHGWPVTAGIAEWTWTC